MENYNLDYLQQLESESIHIIREAVAGFSNPAMLYSIGKDSSVLLHLARKAFLPAKIPFPLVHIDTGYKFKEMIEFRDYYTKKVGVNLIVHQNQEPIAQNMKPDQAHTDSYIFYKKTKPLLEVIAKHQFDAVMGGSRRDEEKSRAKERIFSVRQQNVWDPREQRAELWHLYNNFLQPEQTMRVFPLSNWTELDIWLYIKRENIEVVPLYFAQNRQVIKRHGVWLRLDDYVKPQAGEEITEIECRYRTLGCSPSTGAVPSTAKNIDDIIKEIFVVKTSERVTRAIDHGSESAMEQKKKDGYF